MQTLLFSRKLTVTDHLNIVKKLFIIINGVALLLFAFLRLLFYNYPISTNETLMMFGKTLLIGSTTALGLYILLLLIELTDLLWQRRHLQPGMMVRYSGIAILMGVIFYFSACKAPVVTGITKDLNTGMTTEYHQMKPTRSLLVMNGEEINHTDIPVGEKFVLVNDGISGMTTKNGKISAGCSLQIKDEQGNSVLHEEDLFEGHDVFKEEEAKMLKCTVSTGNPMKWDEKYEVLVKFWDKYGQGSIENKLKIRMIDIP
jgi:hypothetical protein